MNEDNRKKVYEILKSQTGYQDSYEDFNSLFDADEGARKKVYDVLKTQTGYQDSYDDFDQLMGAKGDKEGVPASLRRPNDIVTTEINSVSPQTIANTFSPRESEYPSFIGSGGKGGQGYPGEVMRTDAISNSIHPMSIYQPMIENARPVDTVRDMEEKIIDSQVDGFGKLPKTSDKNILENYKNRYALTNEGSMLRDSIEKKRIDASGRFAKEYLHSDSYKKLSSRYKGKELDEKANEEFNRLYGKKIEEELVPTYNEYRDKMLHRYGDNIQSELTGLAKQNTENQVTSLRKEVERGIEAAYNEWYGKQREYEENHPFVSSMSNIRGGNNAEVTATPINSKKFNDWSAAMNLLDESDKIITEANKNGSPGALLRGIRDGVFDIDAWTWGITDMMHASSLINVVEKADHGKKLAPEEEKLLEAAAVNMATHAYFASGLGREYKAGQTTGGSIPFMLEFALNPVSGSGNAIAKGILKYGIKKFGTGVGKHGVKNALITGGKKMAARLAGDAMAATAMTATTGVGRVEAGTQERMLGDLKFNFDEVGKIQYGGRENQLGVGEAAFKSFASNTLENQSEMIFNAFSGGGKIFGDYVKKAFPGIERFSSSELGLLYNGLKNNTVFREFADRTQFHGLAGEYFEEVYNNIAKIPLGESSWKETFDIDNNIDIICGLAPTCVFMGALGAGGFAVENYRIRRNLNRLADGMSIEQRAKLDNIVKQSKVVGNKDVRNFMKAIVLDRNLTESEKRNKIEYLYNKLQEKAAKAAREEETEETIKKETDEIVNGSNQEDGTFTECNRITTNEIGETVLVPGHIVGWMGGTVVENPDGTKTREGGQPIWQAVGSKERITLKEGEYDPESIKSMSTQEMIDTTSDMLREEAQEKAEHEANYSPEIIPPAIGVAFSDAEGRNYQIVQENPNGGWIANVSSGDEKGNPVVKMEALSDKDYYDLMQSQIDAREESANIQTESSNLSENPVENESMLPAEASTMAPNEETEVDKDGIILSENSIENATSVPAGESNVSENAVPVSPVNELPSSLSRIPLNEKQEPDFEKAPVNDTVDALLEMNDNDAEEAKDTANQMIAAYNKELEKAQKIKPTGSNVLAIQKAKSDRKANIQRISDAITYWQGVSDAITATQEQPGDKTAEAILSMGEPMNGEELADFDNSKTKKEKSTHVNTTGTPIDTEGSRAVASDVDFSSESKDNERFEREQAKDKQGNPIDEQGNLIFEEIESIDQLTNDDFNFPSRSIKLPVLPDNVSAAIGSDRKPVVIKKNIFEKNKNAHKEITPDRSRAILMSALYSPTLIGQVQPMKRPNYWVAIETADKNSVVVLEVSNNKNNVEIVGWRLVDAKGLEKMKRQAEREGGQFLIQTSNNDAAAALSTLPSDLPSENKDSEISENNQEKQDFIAPSPVEGENLLDYAARIEESKRVYDAGKEVNPNPSDAQKKAGNYKKGHVKIDGFDITIENPKGSVRSGVDKDGKPWSVTMNNSYGYIRGTEGVDGDHIDVFVGDNGENVYVVDQINSDGSFDEHKVMYGFNSEEDARNAYLANYSPGWNGLGDITGVSKDEFKKWIDSSHRKTKPFVEYRTVSEKEESSIPVMTEEEYLASKGVSSPVSDYMLDKTRIPHGETVSEKKRREREADKVRAEYSQKREDARNEYQEKIANGELREPSTVEKLIKTANGMPELESTQAARRALKKRGIDWQADDKQFREVDSLNEVSGNSVLSESEYIQNQANLAFNKREDQSLTKEEWEDSDDGIRAYNEASDSYSSYIKSLSDAGALQQIYDSSNIGDKIRIRENIETAGFEVNDLIDTTKEKVESKKKRDAKKKKRAEELMEKLGISSDNIRFREGQELTPEEQTIIDEAKKNGSYMKAPNGEPTNLNEKQWAQVRTESFKNWFGDWENDPVNSSKILDKNGEPLIMYHGSNSSEVFSVFDINKIGRNDWGLRGRGFYFSPDINTAKGNTKGTDNVYSLFLNIRNPFYINSFKSKTDLAKVLDIEEEGIREGGAGYSLTSNYVHEFTSKVKEKGFDGVISSKGGNIFEIVTFEPNQIKSATDNIGTFGINPDIRYRSDEKGIDEVNEQFNEELKKFTEDNADKVHFNLGMPSAALIAGGVEEKPIKLYGSKLLAKMKKHRFTVSDLRDLPLSIVSPIAVFNNIGRKGNRSVLTELRTENGNFLVTIDLGKGEDVDFDIVSSVFGKNDSSVVNWINKGYATYIDKEKALNYLHLSAPIAEASNSSELSSTTKIVESFENPTITQGKIISEVERLATDLHTPVRIVKSVDELPKRDIARKRIEKGHRIKGWFDTKSEEMAIYLPNATSVKDAKESVFHEVVAHYGLRKLFGEDFNTFLDNVYANVSPEIRKQLLNRAKERGNILDLREVTEEYLAELAERGFDGVDERTLWQKIKDAFIDMLRKSGVHLGFDLTDNELRYVLWKSYQNLESQSIMDRAADVDMQRRLRVGNFREDEAKLHYSELKKEVERLKEWTGRDVNLGRNEEEIAFMMSRDGADAGTIDYVRDIFARAREEGKKFFGFFDADTEKVYICADQMDSVENLYAVWAHENGHNATYHNFTEDGLSNLYDALGENRLKRAIPDSYFKMGLSKAMIADEYLSRILADILSDEELFNELVENNIDSVLEGLEMLDNKILPYISRNLKYIFNEKKENYNREDESRNGVVGSGRNEASAKNKREEDQGETERRYRTGKSIGEERGESERIDKSTLSLNDSTFRMSKWEKILEAYQDGMISVKLMQDYLAQKTGKAIPEWMDIYLYENSKSGRSGYRMEQFHKKMYAPLMQEAGRLMQEDRNNGSSVEEAERLLDVYMKAKHGLEERNERMRREAMLKKISSIKNEDAKNIALQEIGEDRIQDVRFSEEGLEKFRVNLLEKDYSGLIGLAGKDENGNDKSMHEAEQYAREAISTYEANHDTKKLWALVKDVSEYALKEEYEGGLIDKDTYDSIKDMYKYYIPLRGRKEKTADDFFNYIERGASDTGFENVIKKAYGHSYESGNAFAYLAKMAEAAIVQAEKNRVKQRLLWMARNYRDPSIMEIANVWYVKDSEGHWVEKIPDLSGTEEEQKKTMAEFSQQMEELQKEGNAKRKLGKVDIGVPISTYQAKEHQVRVKENGREYVININADPRIARAINGDVGNEGQFKVLLDGIDWTVRNLAALNTSWNPEFAVGGIIRDLEYAAGSSFVKEGAGYAAKGAKNTVPAVAAMQRYFRGKQDMSNQMDKYLQEFLENGAETGFTHLSNLNFHEKRARKMLKRASQGKELRTGENIINQANRFIEMIPRFTTYVSSRQSGKSILSSVNDAKNITVNFNRRGSGRMADWRTDGFVVSLVTSIAPILSRMQMFANANIQGTANYFGSAKNHPMRWASATAGVTVMGILSTIISNMLSGDDKPEYKDIPEWVRHSNFTLFNGKSYFSLPLTMEYRPFYTLGESMAMVYLGKSDMKKVAKGIGLSMWDNWNPLSVELFKSGSPTPLLTPIYENLKDEDYKGSKITGRTAWNAYLPEYQRARKGTGDVFMWASEVLNDATKGNKYERGWLQVNPSQLEHLVMGWSGGTGRAVSGLYEVIKSSIAGESPELERVPIVRRFYGEVTSENRYRRLKKEFREEVTEANNLMKSLKAMRKDYENPLDYAARINEIYKDGEYKQAYKLIEANKLLRDFEAIYNGSETQADAKKVMKSMTDIMEEVLNK